MRILAGEGARVKLSGMWKTLLKLRFTSNSNCSRARFWASLIFGFLVVPCRWFIAEPFAPNALSVRVCDNLTEVHPHLEWSGCAGSRDQWRFTPNNTISATSRKPGSYHEKCV